MANPSPSASPVEPSSARRETQPTPAPPSEGAPFLASSHERRPSFDEVRERYSRRVAGWVRLGGVATKDRPDVAQEAWVRIHRALPSYLPDRPIEPWLCTIVRHAVSDHMRRGYVRHEVLAPGPVRRRSVEVEPQVQRRLDAEALLERALAKMPDEEWEVFVLVEVDGVSCTDIAASLGLPEGTVHSRLRRARLGFAATLARMTASSRARTGMFVGPLFVLSWREQWAHFRGWLGAWFLAGAVAGGALICWLLRPASPDEPQLEQVHTIVVAAGTTVESSPPAGAPAMPATPPTPEPSPSPSPLPSPSPSWRPGAPHVSDTASAAGSAKPVSGDDPSAAELAALAAAQSLLRKGECEEARRRLAPHAARLARGPLAPEHDEIRRKLQACSR